MPFGCFGKRRKREKPDELAEKNTNTAADGGDGSAKTDNAVGEVTKLPNSNSDEVSEVIAVARHHSLHASAPSSVEHRHTTIGIQKSATLARYDFLRKSEYANTADRWVALKKQYLTPTMTNSQSQHHHAASGGQNGSVRRAAQSLPRQFAPPALTGGDRTPIRFSQWFYERQTKEAMARQEFHEREEKNRLAEESPADAEEPIDIDLNDPEVQAAAVKIQKGWGNRKAAVAQNQQAPPPLAPEVAPEPPATAVAAESNNPTPQEEEVVDIDLNDPEVQAAALKIQKGWGNRKFATGKQQANSNHEEATTDSGDKETVAAASSEEKPSDEIDANADDNEQNAKSDEAEQTNGDDNLLGNDSLIVDDQVKVGDAIGEQNHEVKEDGVEGDGNVNTADEKHETATKTEAETE